MGWWCPFWGTKDLRAGQHGWQAGEGKAYLIRHQAEYTVSTIWEEEQRDSPLAATVTSILGDADGGAVLF